MPRNVAVAIENSFIKGLITEASGLNFPEKACTETYNCIFTNTGTVSRRKGILQEENYSTTVVDRTLKAISTFEWTNVGGDGNTSIVVKQVGDTLYFYRSSTSTTTDPLSGNLLVDTISLSSFIATGSSSSPDTIECQYASGNGYLFVYHPYCDPFFCTYDTGTITGTVIIVKQRDFQGISEGIEDVFRPPALTANHQYNLQNQGWSNPPGWTATSTTSNDTNTGSHTWTVQSGLSISAGQTVTITSNAGQGEGLITESGTVTSYSGTTLIINVLSTALAGLTVANWSFSLSSLSSSKISAWNSAVGGYPSNSDVWWYFKNTSDVFAPSTEINNVTLGAGPAPKGFYILQSFNQLRSTVSGITGPSDVTTTIRPKTGTWFQGRVWYAGTDYTGFTENIYFSQIVERTEQFGLCYQVNDPTSQDRFDLLPSDGGVIRIQGIGSIYKLFPLQNGLLVFGQGVWFITGSQGIGFTANDYTVTKISDVRACSASSFVNVLGNPYFWNREGVYTLKNDQQTGLSIVSLTDSTIASFYGSIPYDSKIYSRGDYNPLTFTLQWIYKSTQEASVTARYEFDRMLSINLQTGSFSPWSISIEDCPIIHSINYIQYPQGATSPLSSFKYLCSEEGLFTFADERSTTYLDWTDTNYESYFITGYKLRGEGIRKQQTNWIRLYAENDDPSSFDFQSRWDFAISGNQGRWSSTQRVVMDQASDYSNRTKRLKVRGHGLVLQYKITSLEGEPFDILGWITLDTANAGV